MPDKMDWKVVAISVMFLAAMAHEGSVVKGDCVVPPKSQSDLEFPDILGLTSSYKFSLEVNFDERQKSMYVTEYYDELTSRGTVHVEYEGHRTQILYSQEPNELFFITDDVCESMPLFNLTEEYIKERFRIWNWVDLDAEQPILGPSNMLRSGLAAWKDGKMGMEPKTEQVRGITTNVWTYCYQEQDNVVESKYYFIAVEMEKPGDLENVSVPARMTAKGRWMGKDISQNFEFVGFELSVPDKRDTFAIPVQTGCKRQWGAPQVEMPSYGGTDTYLEADVIYQSPFQKENLTYVTTITVALDGQSHHVAFTATPWTTDGKVDGAGDAWRRIYDLKRDIVYIVVDSQNYCNISASSEDNPELIFPDGRKLNMLDPDFIFMLSPKDYHYLGEGVERAIPASIFEKTLDFEDGVSQRIITRYYISGDVSRLHENSEPNAPLRIIFKDMNLDDPTGDKLVGTVDVHIFSFSSRLTQKAAKFDVTLCFPEPDQSKWFQLILPMAGASTRDVMPLIPYIQDNLVELLNDVPIVDSPLRLPKVKVDVDPDNIYVTALLLERPRYLVEFTVGKNAMVKSGESRMISTLEDCAERCYRYDACSMFSYCGAMCLIQGSPADEGNIDNNANCTLYRVRHSKANAILSMDDVANNVLVAMQEPSKLKLLLNKETTMEFTVKKFRFGINFAEKGEIIKPEENLEDRFTTYRVGQKFDRSVANEAGANLQPRFSFSRCKRLCLMSSTCQSVSYCLANAQCYLSNYHGDEIPEDHIAKDTQCAILSRTYGDYFRRYEGILLARKADLEVDAAEFEDCARACVKTKEIDCLSFDHCPSASDGVKTCLLHKVHFLDLSEPDDVKGAPVCGHYSRSHVHEFQQLWHQELTGSGGTTFVEASAESCARRCVNSATCKGFNHCVNYADATSSCVVMTTSDKSTRSSTNCSAYLKK